MEKEQPEKGIEWHLAFIEALKMELQAYKEVLEFDREHPLASKPLEIDCVVIKKVKDVAIKKNIAAIFRNWNILEYKSPGDYVSVDDFYKVYAYACLYKSFEKVPITDLTVSFVESHYPRKLLEHMEKERGYKIAETSPGIYTVSGDIFPMQAIDSRKLPMEENVWLKSLSDKLDLNAFKRVSGEIARQEKGAHIGAYLEAISRANHEMILEAIRMGDAQMFEKVFEEVGWIAKWEARGRAEGKAEGEKQKALAIAQNMVNLGLPAETVISATGLEPEKVKALYKQ
ncbi:MAG: hypothetical protein LBC52_02575 [Treponema sp.]|jgi:hypothetical protein|nr:hypothetical protein [Treponema sp.]